MADIPVDTLLEQAFAGKFIVTIINLGDGPVASRRVVHFINYSPYGVLKLDDEQTYLWYRDPRVGQMATLLDE